MTKASGAGRSHGALLGASPRVFSFLPRNTPAEESSWRQGRRATELAGARVMFGQDPMIFGWGQTQATEMTFLQPLSASSFLASLVPAPTPSCLLWEPCSTIRSFHVPCQLASWCPPRRKTVFSREAPCHQTRTNLIVKACSHSFSLLL